MPAQPPMIPPIKSVESSFLHRLPLEIREKVYDSYFRCVSLQPEREKRSRIHMRARLHPDPDGRNPITTWHAEGPPWLLYRENFSTLFRVCRQTYDEAIRVYYRDRSLNFLTDEKEGTLEPESVGAILSVRTYLLELAKKHPTALLDLAQVNLDFDCNFRFHLNEIFDILQGTLLLLSNWRRPESLILPMFFRLQLIAPTSGLQGWKFNLPAHDYEQWRIEWLTGVWADRKHFTSGSDADLDCLAMLDRAEQYWLVVRRPAYLPDCAEQAGCTCTRHRGRTHLAVSEAKHRLSLKLVNRPIWSSSDDSRKDSVRGTFAHALTNLRLAPRSLGWQIKTSL